MTVSLLECVPNFSEGRDLKVLEALVDAMTGVSGVAVLGAEMDADHHRAVVTMAGPAEALIEAVLAAAEVALAAIDLREHRGVHRRMGAMDVCPFVPIGDTPMSLAVNAARALAARLGQSLDLPVFLYGEACQRPERRVLGAVRNLEFETLCELVGTDPDFAPDHGPPRMHPSAGAFAVGARPFLIAYNVNLRSSDVGVARRIAHRIRERDGGLTGVQALGFLLAGSDRAQVSTNLLDYRRTGLCQVFDAVQAEARSQGVEIEASEVVGLLPADALDQAIAEHILLPAFDPERRILERRLAAVGMG